MKVWTWLVISVAGVIMVLAGTVLLRDASADLATFESLREGSGVAAPATVTGLYPERSRNSRSGKNPKIRSCPDYHFTDAQGNLHFIRLGVKCSHTMKIGDYPAGTAIYDPSKTYISYLDSEVTLELLQGNRNIFLKLIVGGWLIIALCAGGIVKIAVARKRKSPQ